MFLSIVNLLISRSDDYLWVSSLPIGNEAYRLIKLTKSYELTIYNFQRLHKLRSINEADKNNYDMIEMKFSHIGIIVTRFDTI